MEPDDVVIANNGGQALDIFLHRPDSASKNGILKANIHPYIQSHSPMRTLKQTKTKPSTHQTRRLRLLVLFLSNVVLGDDQEVRHVLRKAAPLRRSSDLGQY